MKVMSEEYCRSCPFFMSEKGWLSDDDPFWQENPDAECMCKECPRRQVCETDGPVQSLLVCFQENKDYLDEKVKERLNA